MKKPFYGLPHLFLPLILSLIYSVPAFCEPPNLGLARQEVQKYHDSGRYEHELTQHIAKAQKYIIHEAIKNQQNKNPHKLALVLDIDETSLSNYTTLTKYHFATTKDQFHQAIQAADAPVIKPMLMLYRDALKHGVSVFFVTGRDESEREVTKNNLIKAGYTQWSGLYLRPHKYSLPSIIPFKSEARAKITQQGYTIIASIGDQYSDIEGGYTQKGFKLPNPFYYIP